jgi:hypothetical protein
MNALTLVVTASGVAAMFALGSISAIAQADGSGYHPLQLNSPNKPEVDAGAVAAAHSPGTEAVGQSTSRPARTSKLTRAEVEKQAIEANHAMRGEPEGQSTAMAAVHGGAAR